MIAIPVSVFELIDSDSVVGSLRMLPVLQRLGDAYDFCLLAFCAVLISVMVTRLTTASSLFI